MPPSLRPRQAAAVHLQFTPPLLLAWSPTRYVVVAEAAMKVYSLTGDELEAYPLQVAGKTKHVVRLHGTKSFTVGFVSVKATITCEAPPQCSGSRG